ncbi:Alpha-N-acetylglucosaminidase [Glycine max]|nr:Alpha-N-acetylglucosaminidase [Glycine max]
MKIPFPAIYLIFTFSLPSSTGAGIDTISRLIRIQDRERAPPSVRRKQCGGEYCFKIKNHPSFKTQGNIPQILIEGTTGVDIVAGLHWYLKHWRGSHVSWDKRDGTPYITPFTIALMEHIQVLAKYANELFFKVIEAYQLQDVDGMTLLSPRFLDLVEDLDTLKQVLERASTYVPRAAIYFKYLRESLENGEDFKLTEWRREWIKLTNEWQKRRNIFTTESRGDALNTSRWLFNKYPNLRNSERKLILEY